MTKIYATVAELPAREAREQGAELANLPRLPALEKLLARGEHRPVTPDWRRWALGVAGLEAPPGDLPLGRWRAAAAGLGHDGQGTWLVATPLGLSAGLTAVQVEATSARLSAAAAIDLAARFNAEWGEEAALHALGGALLLRHCARLEVVTTDPALLAGRALAPGLPRGPGSARLTRLMTEIQMWLHAGPTATPGLNNLWLWGAGQGDATGEANWPVFRDLDAGLEAVRTLHPGRTQSDARLARWSVAQLLSRGAALSSADPEWFRPLAQALARGETTAAELHIGSTAVRLAGRQRFRVWVRPRPWWELIP
jgi:hypothetical protein